MPIVFNRLFALMESKNIKRVNLRFDYGLNSKTVATLGKNGSVSTYTIERLCEILDCQPGDIMEYIPEKGKK